MTWFALVNAVSALDTDISPVLLPFKPILSKISPRVRPLPAWMTFSSSRFEPRRWMQQSRGNSWPEVILRGVARIVTLVTCYRYQRRRTIASAFHIRTRRRAGVSRGASGISSQDRNSGVNDAQPIFVQAG